MQYLDVQGPTSSSEAAYEAAQRFAEAYNEWAGAARPGVLDVKEPAQWRKIRALWRGLDKAMRGVGL